MTRSVPKTKLLYFCLGDYLAGFRLRREENVYLDIVKIIEATK